MTPLGACRQRWSTLSNTSKASCSWRNNKSLLFLIGVCGCGKHCTTMLYFDFIMLSLVRADKIFLEYSMSLSFTSSGESSSAHQARGKQMSSGRGTTPRFRYRSEDLTSALCCCRCPCNMLVLAIDRETINAPCSWTPQCCRLPPQRHFPPVVAQMGIHAFHCQFYVWEWWR